MKRYYRLFSDSYDTKEQWFNVLKQIMLAKERMEEDQKQQIAQSIQKAAMCELPANIQG